jgi:hypothetical protein
MLNKFNSKYIWEDDGTLRQVEDGLDQWGKWYEPRRRGRHVADTLIKFKNGNTRRVSTIFLGIDHNWGPGAKPVLWESLVFFDKDSFSEIDGRRYSSAQEAWEGHWALVHKHLGDERSPCEIENSTDLHPYGTKLFADDYPAALQRAMGLHSTTP